MEIFVVTDSEAGWDCVQEVFDTYQKAKEFKENCGDRSTVMVIHQRKLQ